MKSHNPIVTWSRPALSSIGVSAIETRPRDSAPEKASFGFDVFRPGLDETGQTLRQLQLVGRSDSCLVSEWAAPPDPDEVEVALFGPGKGECVVVHLGSNEWMVVDSCLGDDRNPAASTYLTSLGVAPESVRLIVASHWHDDHVGGLGKLVEQYAEAEVFCSAALEADELFHLVAAADQRPMVATTSGVHEFRRVLDALDDRDGTLRFGIADRILYRRTAAPGCEVQALSPSDASKREGLEHLSTLLDLQTMADERRTVPRPLRNPGAVVVWVHVGDVRLLLAADLEVDADPRKGWLAVLDAAAAPKGRAGFVKVAHHGSENGHEDRVWQEMLEEEVYAGLTPYLSGRTPIPRPTDVQRIVALTPNCWMTRSPGTPKVKRDWRIERMVDEAALWLRASEVGNAGALRYRRRVTGGSWRVHASGSARRLT